MKTLRFPCAALALSLGCAALVQGCGTGVDEFSSEGNLSDQSRHRCSNDKGCHNHYLCQGGYCQKPGPHGGCKIEHDCSNGGLCQGGQCVAMACDQRGSGKTGIRATVLITQYQGVIHGRNGDHEIAYGTLGNVEWIYSPSIRDTDNVQLAMNISSSRDPTGLPHEIPVAAGSTIEVEGEYISAASASLHGDAVIHFTHSTCGYVTIGANTYQ